MSDKVLDSLAWRWCADAIIAVAKGEVASCEVKPFHPDGGSLAMVIASAKDGSADAQTMDKGLAVDIADRINQALVLCGREKEEGPPAPAHRLKSRRVSEYFHDGRLSIHVTRKQDRETASEILLWEAICDEDGNPVDWYIPRDEGGIRYAVMRWKFKKWGSRKPMPDLEECLTWRNFSLREDLFRDLIMTGDASEIPEVLTRGFGPLSDHEVSIWQTESE